ARRLSDFRRHPAPFAERVLVVLHMDHSVAVLLPQSGMAAADDSAIPVVPHADPLRHPRRLALEPAHDFADVRTILRVASWGHIQTRATRRKLRGYLTSIILFRQCRTVFVDALNNAFSFSMR